MLLKSHMLLGNPPRSSRCNTAREKGPCARRRCGPGRDVSRAAAPAPGERADTPRPRSAAPVSAGTR